MWMLASRRGRKMRQQDGSWHTRRVKEYLHEVDKFRELLLFCMHVTGSQPARGPDVLSLSYKNGLSQDRNIFVLDGLVMSVTWCHKTLSQWDVPKAVPRFMPWRVGQLVTVYLNYVQPLMDCTSQCSTEGAWKQRKWDGNGLDVLWFDHFDHGQAFDRSGVRARLVRVVQSYCESLRGIRPLAESSLGFCRNRASS
jgi:hypothetical protein